MPFTAAQFLDVFRRYNESIWPAQWLLNAIALIAIALAVVNSARASRAASLLLATLWAWAGIVYHIVFFARINPLAIAFGALFVVEALLILWFGVARERIRLRFIWSLRGAIGALFVAYALVLYPAIGFLMDRQYPATPSFGVPCPTTIFTFGLFLWSWDRFPRRLLAIPAAWSLLGFSAARSFAIVEDYGLLIAGLVGTILIVFSDWPRRRAMFATPKELSGGIISSNAG